MTQWMARQGDVLFKKVRYVPKGGKIRKSGHIMEGETTGHVHRVSEAQLADAEVLNCGAGLFIRVTGERGVSIVHEEHNPIMLPPGDYEIVRQREYYPEEIRNVKD